VLEQLQSNMNHVEMWFRKESAGTVDLSMC